MTDNTRLDDLLNIATARQNLPSGLFHANELNFTVEQPTAVIFWSDWHLGAQGTDYQTFQKDVGTLTLGRELLGDQMVLLANGDFIDGYLPTGTPKNPTQILSPKEQRHAATQAMLLTRPDLIIEGDHDAWHSKQDIEHEWLAEFAADHDFNFAQWGTEVNFVTKAKTVKLLIRHRFRGSRAADSIRPHKNLHLDHGPADLIALAHTHSQPGVFRTHAKRRNEGEFYAIQSGTYKSFDDYGKKLGYTSADYGVPAVIIRPDGSIKGYDKYQDALEVLT